MAELTAFHFRPGTSLLHTLDVRFKILSFVLIQFHNNEEGLSGYSQIIQIFKTLIKYHYNLINFTIYAFISVFTIIFNIIRSIRG